MGPKTHELISALDDLIILLINDDEQYWREYLIKVRNRLKASDFLGITMLSDAFGAMGSINDLVLAYDVPKVPGPVVWKPNAKEINEQFSSLLGDAYELVFYIKRNAEIN